MNINKSIKLVLNPNVAHTYNLSNIYIDTGNSLSEKGDFDNAILCYREVLKLNPTDAITYNNLGVAYQMKGQINEAIINYQKAIKIDLNFAEAHFHLSHANLLSGNFEEGWKEYDWRLKSKDMGFQHSFSQPA
jgi:tetratricopeptide (TPR) repeat protein